MKVSVDNKYIWFPVQTGAGREKVEIRLLPDTAADAEVKLFEFDLPVASERVDYYAALCVEAYLGRTLYISVNFPVEGMGSLAFHDQEPPENTDIRPMLHFTS